MPFSKKQLLISKPFENPNFIQSNHFTGTKPGVFLVVVYQDKVIIKTIKIIKIIK